MLLLICIKGEMKLAEYMKSSSSFDEALEVILGYFKKQKVILRKGEVTYNLEVFEDYEKVRRFVFFLMGSIKSLRVKVKN